MRLDHFGASLQCCCPEPLQCTATYLLVRRFCIMFRASSSPVKLNSSLQLAWIGISLQVLFLCSAKWICSFLWEDIGCFFFFFCFTWVRNCNFHLKKYSFSFVYWLISHMHNFWRAISGWQLWSFPFCYPGSQGNRTFPRICCFRCSDLLCLF